MTQVTRRTAALMLAATGLALSVSASAQDTSDYPNKPIRIVIPTPAGGALDGTARLIGEKLGAAWKQPVIVDNRAGGNGAIAYGAVAKSPPDGHTVLLSLSSLVQTLLLTKTTSYSLQELTPVSLVAMLPNGFAVGKAVPATTVQQFVEWARTQPSGVDYGSSGAGSSGNIMGGTLAHAANIQLVHVPFKGEVPAIQAVIGGQMASMFGATGSLATQAKAGHMKLLAVALPNRLKDYPEVPTFAEAGYPNVNLSGWSVALVPAGTPKSIVDKLATEITRIVRLPDVSARIHGYGFQPEGGSPEAARSFVNAEMARWDAAIKAANIKLE
ncbi:MAG: tripartite tricarboxylate transporter substrate binding protein [Sulfuricaulis sp.]|nr:tripartite tricarboxylate transporter substrate binding protein [Sulfuricaulis sp.]